MVAVFRGMARKCAEGLQQTPPPAPTQPWGQPAGDVDCGSATAAADAFSVDYEGLRRDRMVRASSLSRWPLSY
jgi:hypothetical protein